jgi:CRP/FNR family transcriptional regulator
VTGLSGLGIPPDMEINEKDLRTLSEFPLFEGISYSELMALLTNSRVRTYNHRGVFFEAGDEALSFGVVLEGAYKLVKPTAKGDDFIMYFATPGDAIGALLMGQPKTVTYPISVKAIGCSRICNIPKSTFQTYWKSNAQILLRLNSVLYSRMGIMQDEKALLRAPLAQRIAWFLMKMLERNVDCEDQIIPLPLTRQEIADHLGVTVESVIRIMSQWTQSGIVKSADRSLEIARVDQLIELLKEVE